MLQTLFGFDIDLYTRSTVLHMRRWQHTPRSHSFHYSRFTNAFFLDRLFTANLYCASQHYFSICTFAQSSHWPPLNRHPFSHLSKALARLGHFYQSLPLVSVLKLYTKLPSTSLTLYTARLSSTQRSPSAFNHVAHHHASAASTALLHGARHGLPWHPVSHQPTLSLLLQSLTCRQGWYPHRSVLLLGQDCRGQT
jgi:hypothetical protein